MLLFVVMMAMLMTTLMVVLVAEWGGSMYDSNNPWPGCMIDNEAQSIYI